MSNHSVEPVKQPQPVLSRAAVVTVIHTLAALCVVLGAGSVSGWLGAHADLIASAVLAVAPLVTAYLSRGKVTPTGSPKDNDGNVLVPAGSAEATVEAASVLARSAAIVAGSDA